MKLPLKAELPTMRSEKRPLLEDNFAGWRNSLVDVFL
jgi:hypothetical protein